MRAAGVQASCTPVTRRGKASGMGRGRSLGRAGEGTAVSPHPRAGRYLLEHKGGAASLGMSQSSLLLAAQEDEGG